MKHAKHRGGVYKPGEQHPNAKLKEDDVLEIRRLYAGGGISQKTIADSFGVGQAQVAKIVRRQGWTHV